MTRSELLASLTATNPDRDGIVFDEDEGRYIDWSTKLDDDEGLLFEVGGEGEVAQLGLTWSEIERLHRALTLLLLEHETTEA